MPTRRLNGEDPTAYVTSKSVHRRHITKSQRAKRSLRSNPILRRTSAAAPISEDLNIGRDLLFRARTVLRFAPERAELASQAGGWTKPTRKRSASRTRRTPTRLASRSREPSRTDGEPFQPGGRCKRSSRAEATSAPEGREPTDTVTEPPLPSEPATALYHHVSVDAGTLAKNRASCSLG